MRETTTTQTAFYTQITREKCRLGRAIVARSVRSVLYRHFVTIHDPRPSNRGDTRVVTKFPHKRPFVNLSFCEVERSSQSMARCAEECTLFDFPRLFLKACFLPIRVSYKSPRGDRDKPRGFGVRRRTGNTRVKRRERDSFVQKECAEGDGLRCGAVECG